MNARASRPREAEFLLESHASKSGAAYAAESRLMCDKPHGLRSNKIRVRGMDSSGERRGVGGFWRRGTPPTSCASTGLCSDQPPLPSEGGGGLAQGLGMRLFAFGGAYWPLATAHSDPLWARTCFGCVNGALE